MRSSDPISDSSLTTRTYSVKSLFKDEQGSRETNDQNRLGGDDAEDDSLDASGDHKL